MENKQNLQLPQGAGIQAAQRVAEHGAKMVLTGNCGPKAFKVLKAAGVKVGGISGTVKEAINQYKQGKISLPMPLMSKGHWG